MARASERPTEEATSHGAGSKKGRGLLIAVVAGVLVLAIGGLAAWLLLSGRDESTAGAKSVAEVAPLFFALEPFVVNLAGDVERYLQVGIELKVADSTVNDRIKEHLPEIRNGVLLLLSSKHPEELATLEGKNQLRREIRAAVNAPLGIETPVAPAAEQAASATGQPTASDPSDGQGVLDVLLTSFVIQ
jgi:flagellar FliL protein